MWAWLVGGFLVFLVLAMGAVAFYLHDSGPESCDSYEFNSDKWLSYDDTDNEAGDMVRCKTLNGMSQADVLDTLGSTWLNDRSRSLKTAWIFRAGEVDDGYGGTERQQLYVNFNGKGNVTGTTLAYPETD